MIRVITLFILVFATIARVDAAVAPERWMSLIPGSRYISEISIPGTHDSGAFRAGDSLAPLSTYNTQFGTSTIKHQLDMGVRYLDIRCNQIENICAIHHGAVYLFQTLDDILLDVYGFLDKNPTETVLMSIKDGEAANPGNNTIGFSETVNNYIAKNPRFWYTGAITPTLNDARGRIVLFRRFGDTAKNIGINIFDHWPGNTSSQWVNTDGVSVAVQDQYSIPASQSYTAKETAIKALLSQASGQPNVNKTLYINFTSAYSGVPNPHRTALAINPKVRNYFTKHKAGLFGVVVMDFIDPALAAAIFNSNF